MNPREKGFLLLSSHLGDPRRKPLSHYQLRILAQRARSMEKPEQDRELTEQDLIALGYSREMAGRILQLLEQTDVLDHYLSRGRDSGCFPVSRISREYPQLLRQRLGQESPGCLWGRGDPSLLGKPAISLVGSRELREENRRFAEKVGILAARNALVLVSGNARGADKAAQEACLAAGGQVISIVADALCEHPRRERVLYVSEDGFSEAFSSQRALSRNCCIHAMGQMVFVAQASLEKGGTWDGTAKNLRHGWSTVVCFRDESPASTALEQMGAWLIGMEELQDFSFLPAPEPSLFDSF